MNLHQEKRQVIATFSANEYWLVENVVPYQEKWTLNPKIDRSYKGKDPDVASPVLFLSEEGAMIFRNAGFDEMKI